MPLCARQALGKSGVEASFGKRGRERELFSFSVFSFFMARPKFRVELPPKLRHFLEHVAFHSLLNHFPHFPFFSPPWATNALQ
jgi:hypothetical protein